VPRRCFLEARLGSQFGLERGCCGGSGGRMRRRFHVAAARWMTWWYSWRSSMVWVAR